VAPYRHSSQVYGGVGCSREHFQAYLGQALKVPWTSRTTPSCSPIGPRRISKLAQSRMPWLTDGWPHRCARVFKHGGDLGGRSEGRDVRQGLLPPCAGPRGRLSRVGRLPARAGRRCVCATVFPALPSDLMMRVARPQSQLAVPARQAEGGLCRPCRLAALDALTLLLDGPYSGSWPRPSVMRCFFIEVPRPTAPGLYYCTVLTARL
jgi:hypothetical protein